ADDDSIRPLGRVTGGVTGMKFKDDDELLTMDVVQPDTYVFVVTEAGYAKRTPVEEYRLQGRGGLGIRVAKITEQRGDLVGGLIVDEGEEVLVVMEKGKIVRSSIDEVPAKGRNTMGVVFAKPGKNDRIIAVTRGPETAVEEIDDDEAEVPEAEVDQPQTGSEDVEDGSTRLTAGGSKNEDKTSGSSGSAGNSGSSNSAKSAGNGSGQSAQSSQASEKATVVAPPAPKASPKPNRAPSTGSGPRGGSAPGGSAQNQGGSAPSAQSGAQGSQGATGGSQGTTGGSQGSSGGNRTATSVMGSAANTVRASSGGVKMGVKNMVENGKGKKKKGPRTVRLTVAAVDPWSVMKMSFLMSVAIGIATIVAFIVLWVVLQATGVMSGLETTMSELAGAESAERIVGIFGFGRVVAAGFIIAVINIVLMTALSTLAAFIYNIGSLIAGGFHLTLTDD
uniref:DUF3566 domain-containing protein n=1 Tax=Caenorhabditis japonica TaxID=281687 RepID=A0A8R1IU25_CAEJA